MVVFLLLPVALLMTTMGWFRFSYAKENLVKEWRESAVLKLQRAAHRVDMRLSEPKLWMRMFAATGGEPGAEAMQEWILQQLRHLQGVAQASLVKSEQDQSTLSQLPGQRIGMQGCMMFERAGITQVTPPHLSTRDGQETVSLISELLSSTKEKVGQLDVTLHFDYLIEDAVSYGWKQGEMASLIDDQGKLLACSVPAENRRPNEHTFKAVLKEVAKTPSGTIISPPSQPGDVIGFFRLKEAPWTLVLTARESEILAPIDRFRNVFLLTGALFTVFILLLIRRVAGPTVASIRGVSHAAQRVAQGDYQVRLATAGGDEVGQLIHSFNTMVAQLEERMRLKEALDLAMKVQQNLLPAGPPRLEGLDIAGTCVYCDQTGGDYYDFLQCSESGKGKIGLAVGDVAGHGISAALLMTTARAMIRTRMLQPGSLAQVADDVNRLLCHDTERTSDFMTLFLAVLDAKAQELSWVRAGHAPALIYDWQSDSFEELKGDGVALGLDNFAHFKEYRYCNWSHSKLLFVGTDGIWESENPQGEQFGMERLRTILRREHRSSSQQIMRAVLDAIKDFGQGRNQEDDITMVIIKSR